MCDDVQSSPVRNPSPPPELVVDHADLAHADMVGETVFSKHTIFDVLMKLIQAVDKEDSREDALLPDAAVTGLDVDDDLQNELCKLWDMTISKDVAEFLQDYKAVDILYAVIAQTKAPRVTEICVGILGNMACLSSICNTISSDEKLVELILLLLGNRDPPTLLEVTRLVHTCLSDRMAAMLWMKAIKASTSILEDVTYVFCSSTNIELLHSTAEFVDKAMALDDDLCLVWASVELVSALLEAIKQIGKDSYNTCDSFIHICQLLSTIEPGVKALVSHASGLYHVLLHYLERVCKEDIVVVDDEASLASALSVMNILFVSDAETMNKCLRDEKLTRCLLKILEQQQPGINESSKNSSPVEPHNCHDLTKGDSSSQGDKEMEPKHSASTSQVSIAEMQTDGHVTDESNLIVINNNSVKDSYSESGELYTCLRGFIIDSFTVLTKENKPSKILNYLNSDCKHRRITFLVQCISDEAADRGTSLVSKLQIVSEDLRLHRLRRIIKETLSSMSSSQEVEDVCDSVDSDEKPLQDDERTPDDERTLPDVERTLPDDKRTLPDDERTLPDDERTLPDDERTLLGDERTLPDDERTLPE